MSNVSKIVRVTVVIFICSFLVRVNAEELITVETGDEDSASWQFVTSLSKEWKLKFMEKGSVFVPRRVEGIRQRFSDLEKGRCGLIIAPLKSITDLPSSEVKIKVVLTLWETYLLPIRVGSGKAGVWRHRYWFIPEGSVIIPTVFAMSKRPYLRWSNPDDRLRIEQSSEQDEVTNPIRRKMVSLKTREMSEVFSLMDDGILFYEMLGPHQNIAGLFGGNPEFSDLGKSLRKLLLERMQWLEPFRVSRKKISTVGLMFALFARQSEDVEFIKNLISTLMVPPTSMFKKPYMMENLSLSETKSVSPLFLHEGTLSYFHID